MATPSTLDTRQLDLSDSVASGHTVFHTLVLQSWIALIPPHWPKDIILAMIPDRPVLWPARLCWSINLFD